MLAVTGSPLPDSLQHLEWHATCTQVTVKRGLPPRASVGSLKAKSTLVSHDKLSISNLHEIVSTLKILLILSGNNLACGFGIIICDLNKLDIYRAGSFISNLLQDKKKKSEHSLCPL